MLNKPIGEVAIGSIGELQRAAAAGANAVVVVWGVALLDMVSLPDPSFL